MSQSQTASPPAGISAYWIEARELLRLAGPLIAAQVAIILMHTVDAVMAGRLGAQALAAVALGGSLWVPPFVFAMGVLMAVSPTVAHLYGAGRHQEVGPKVRQAMWLAVFVAIPVVVYLFNCGPILSLMNVPADVIPVTTGFLRALACGVPAILVYTALRSFCEGISDTRPMMVISFIGLLGNIAGNNVFMHGWFGLPALGAVGTGVATAVVMWLMLGCLLLWIRFNDRCRPFELFARYEWPDAAELLALVRLGAPIGTSLFLECSLFSIVSMFMGSLGAAVIGGHQIALNFASLTFMVPLGIAMAITVRVGQALGRGDPIAARRAGSLGIGLSVSFMGLAAIVMFVIPHRIAAVYTQDAEVHAMAVMLLGMAAIFQLSDGFQVSGSGALRGLKDTTVPMFITLTAYWIIGLPLALAWGLWWGGGPRGFWWGLIAGLTAAALLMNVRFFWLMGRLIAKSPPTETDEPLAVPEECLA